MPKTKKPPKEMTTDELAAHVFHPKVLKHAKKHLVEAEKLRTRRKSAK